MMDFNVTTTAPVVREFLAVVLAGFGNELVPLTSDHGEDPCPKALLPIGNKPMIDNVMEWVDAAGVRDVLLICPTLHKHAMSHHVHSNMSPALSTLQIDVKSYDETADSGEGTCEILRHFSDQITGNFILLSCDFIPPPSLPLSKLLDKFRMDSLDGAVLTTCWYATQKGTEKEKSAFAEGEWGATENPTGIVWDENTKTLVHIDSMEEHDRDSEEMLLRLSLLKKYPRLRLSQKFQDSHAYVCKHAILNALREKQRFDSFREDFLPWLCKVQYSKSKRSHFAPLLQPDADESEQNISMDHSSLFTSAETQQSSLRIGIVIHRDTSPEQAAVRINTIPSYMDANRRRLTGNTYALPSDTKDRSLIDPKAQIASDSIVGGSTQVSERSTIKRSIIGHHCVIGKYVRIVGCVLLDHCIVEDGAKLDGCILGTNTKIGSKAELKACITQAGYEAASGESAKGEKLEVSDWTAGASEDIDEDEEEEEESESQDEDESEVDSVPKASAVKLTTQVPASNAQLGGKDDSSDESDGEQPTPVATKSQGPPSVPISGNPLKAEATLKASSAPTTEDISEASEETSDEDEDEDEPAPKTTAPLLPPASKAQAPATTAVVGDASSDSEDGT